MVAFVQRKMFIAHLVKNIYQVKKHKAIKMMKEAKLKKKDNIDFVKVNPANSDFEDSSHRINRSTDREKDVAEASLYQLVSLRNKTPKIIV